MSCDLRKIRIKSFQTEFHKRIGQRIGIDMTVNRQLMDLWRQMEFPVFIRIVSVTVCVDIGNSHLQVDYILKRIIDIDFRNTGRTGNIQISLMCQFTVGIGSRNTGQSVISAVEYRHNLIVGKQFIHRNDIDTVAAQDPHIPALILVQVKVIGVREFLNRFHMIRLIHISNRVAGDDPEYMMGRIFFDPHHNI